MILCRFDIPLQTHVEIPGDSGFFFPTEERDVTIHCETKDGAKLFSYTGEQLGWLTNEYEIETFAVRKTRDQQHAMLRTIYRRKDGDLFEGGTVDPIKYTLMHVMFELDSTELLTDEIQWKKLIQWTQSVISHFINAYRLVTQEEDVVNPRLIDSPVLEVFISKKYEFTSEGCTGEFQPFKRQYFWMNPLTSGHLKPRMSDDQARELSKLLQTGASIPLFQQLLADAKELSHIRGQHDLAIIVIENAFEVYLQQRLISACESRGITDLPYGRGRGETEINYTEAIEKGGVKEYLIPYVERLAGATVKGGAEYQSWHELTYTKRNDIIHRGARGADADHAGKAFMAVVSLIALIEGLLT